MGFPPAMELRGQAFPTASQAPRCDQPQRHGNFPAQPRREGEFARIALAPCAQRGLIRRKDSCSGFVTFVYFCSNSGTSRPTEPVLPYLPRQSSEPAGGDFLSLNRRSQRERRTAGPCVKKMRFPVISRKPSCARLTAGGLFFVGGAKQIRHLVLPANCFHNIFGRNAVTFSDARRFDGGQLSWSHHRQ